MKHIKRILPLLLALALMAGLAAVPAAATGDRTYTVTANLFVPGELNTQLPGVTAYVTNGNNPLGLGGYEAKAPTEPVSSNATLTVSSSGKVTLYVPLPNPVFTVQKIGGCSNAKILSAPRDSEVYATQDGSVSRSGRITSITLELLDTTGTYVFTDCTEFPTLLGVDWSVPLTLNVDFTGVDFSATSSGGVNTDALRANIQTVEQVVSSAIVSADGSDVAAADVWTTQAELNALKTALSDARGALSSDSQSTVDNAAAALGSAYDTYKAALKAGTKQAESEHLGKTLSPGIYTVSANIWFNKADTGLPLNPHLTNSTFPPYNPVPDNATLTVNADGSADLVIPIVIQDKVMTLRELRGPTLTDVQKTDDGAITSVTVHFDALSGDSTVVTDVWEADIEMGDLAMSISGLDKPHTWPAQFELNLSGVATTDGGVMPTVELTLIDNKAAAEAMASVGATDTDETETAEPEDSGLSAGAIVAIVVAVALVAAGIAYYFIRKKKQSVAPAAALEETAKKDGEQE